MTATTDIQDLDVSLFAIDEAVRQVLDWARSARTRLVVTPNTDHFVRWKRDPVFRDFYKRADLRTADGISLPILARAGGKPIPPRVTGVDLLMRCAQRASEQGIPLFIVGGQPGIADRARERLISAYPKLRIPQVSAPDATELFSTDYIRTLATAIAGEPTKIVALCLGSPKQERLFIDLEKLNPGIGGVFLCVGAAVDFAAGTSSRAPKAIRAAGLEWLYRLIIEPRRLWRRYLLVDTQIIGYIFTALRQRL